MSDNSEHTLLICETCQGPLGPSDLQDMLQERLPRGFAIQSVSCMAGCERPMTVGFQAPGKASYLFGDIMSVHDIEALAEFAHQYQRSADGWTNATHRPWQLFTKTLARLPAMAQGPAE